MVKGHRVNHVLHLILTLVTLGLWGGVWLLLAIFKGERRRYIGVGEIPPRVSSGADAVNAWVELFPLLKSTTMRILAIVRRELMPR